MSDFGSYRELMRSPENSPGWLLRPRGAAWLSAVGVLKDGELERLKAAIKLRFATKAPPDGLARLGEDRVIERGPTDTDATYAARLVDAWNSWKFGGTPFGLLTALREAGFGGDPAYPGPRLEIVNGHQFHLDLAGELVDTPLRSGLWSCHATRTHWASFCLYWPVVSNPFAPAVPANDDPRLEPLRRIVRNWKPAHAQCSGIFLEVSGESWGWPVANAPGGGDTGDWGTLPGALWGVCDVRRYDP